MEIKLETLSEAEVSCALKALGISENRSSEVLEILFEVRQDSFRKVLSVQKIALYVCSGVLRVLNDLVVEIEGKELALQSDIPCFVITPKEPTEKKSWHYVHPSEVSKLGHPQIP